MTKIISIMKPIRDGTKQWQIENLIFDLTMQFDSIWPDDGIQIDLNWFFQSLVSVRFHNKLTFRDHISEKNDKTYSVCMYREGAGLYQRVDTGCQRAHTPSPSDSQL